MNDLDLKLAQLQENSNKISSLLDNANCIPKSLENECRLLCSELNKLCEEMKEDDD